MRLKKGSMIVIGLVTTLLAIAVVPYVYHLHRERVLVEEELRVEREAGLEIIYTYLRLHYAFNMVSHEAILETDDEGYWGGRAPNIYRRFGVYKAISPSHINEHGVDAIIYLLTRFYYHRSGVYLSYKVVEDYFSEEFEPDGSLRLYNNGKHPEIEAFVTWMWEDLKGEEFNEFVRRIQGKASQYRREHRDHGFERQGPIDVFSPQMLDALARAEADPDYVLDLTSLQEAGY